MAATFAERLVLNMWSEAARTAARAAQHHGYKQVAATHMFKRGKHTITIGRHSGAWAHTHGNRTIGHGAAGALGKHLKQVHG